MNRSRATEESPSADGGVRADVRFDERAALDGAFLTDLGYNNYDVAPDGTHFLILESVDRQAETIVIHNWAAELRRAWR